MLATGSTIVHYELVKLGGIITLLRVKPLFLCAMVVALFSGCLAVSQKSTGPNVVPNTNVGALIAAAQNVFPQYGYTPGPVSYPSSISFDKPAGSFGKLLYGSYGRTTTFRVRLSMVQQPGTNNFQLSTKVSRVSDAGQAGFEDSTAMMGSGQFGPVIKQIKAQAANAGPGI